MLKLSEREQNLIMIAAALAIFFLFFQFLLAPKWSEIAKLKETARQLRLDLRVAEGKIKALEVLEQRGQVPGKTSQPKEEKALNLLQSFSSASAKSGLELNALKPLLEESREGIKFSLACSGKYQNLYDFLMQLYQQRLFFVIETFDIISSPGPTPNLDIKITLTAF